VVSSPLKMDVAHFEDKLVDINYYQISARLIVGRIIFINSALKSLNLGTILMFVEAKILV
jgi:hypothetical protein